MRSARDVGGIALLLALATLVACSDAGGGADDAPFSEAGSGGSTATTTDTTGVRPPAGGSSAGTQPDTTISQDPPTFIQDEPEPERESEPVAIVEPPSCADMEADACQGESCCRRENVGASEAMVVATNVSVVLTPYALDKYEVTVGRFRKFLETYDDWRDAGNPKTDAGARAGVPGSGWIKDPTWEVALPDSAAVMRVGLNCNPTQQTWTDEPGFNENKPLNCVSWYEAFAFCAWDEGHLPTEMEWQYAASAGAQARQFAWGNAPLAPNFAVYGCLVAGTGANCTADDIPDVGSRPDGDGYYNQSDLNGSVLEWTLDWFAPYPELMRDNYTKTDSGTNRVLRGGCWNTTFTDQITATTRHHQNKPEYRSPATGIRCMRELESSLH
jgi:formylglycine-generating enzyme required for sulfatase activity